MQKSAIKSILMLSLLIAVSLAGCKSSSLKNDECAWSKFIWMDPGDQLTSATTNQIVAQDIKWIMFCNDGRNPDGSMLHCDKFCNDILDTVKSR